MNASRLHREFSSCSPPPERNEATNGPRNESTGSSRWGRSWRGEGRGRSRRGRRMISPDRQPIAPPVPGLSWPPGLMNLEISNPKYDFSRKASRQTKTKTCLTPASLEGTEKGKERAQREDCCQIPEPPRIWPPSHPVIRREGKTCSSLPLKFYAFALPLRK